MNVKEQIVILNAALIGGTLSIACKLLILLGIVANASGIPRHSLELKRLRMAYKGLLVLIRFSSKNTCDYKVLDGDMY